MTPIILSQQGWAQTPVKTFTVNMTSDESDPNAGNIGDDGVCDVDPNTPGSQCTLRAAIENQNGNRNLAINEIKFNIPNAPGTGSIVIKVGSTGLGPLPNVLGAVIINATNGADSRRIEIDGSQAGGNARGLALLGGQCQISNFIINNFSSYGIFISGTPPPGEGSHVIKGNFIGTDATGKISKGNGGDGIYIDNTPNNIIGGTAPGEANIISGNKGYGIVIHGSDPAVDFQTNGAKNNMVKGNFIGLDADANLVLPNEVGGILDDNAPNNRIGDSTDAKAGNKLAGVKNGITVKGSLSEGVGIEGNYFQNGAGAKFTAGVFGRGGKGLYITGNLIDDIDSASIDLFVTADGTYNISKNRFEGGVKVGTKMQFGPGQTAEIDYTNNFHTGANLSIDAQESLNSKIDWLVAGNTIQAGQTGANMVFRAAGNKDFSKNTWQGNAGIGFNFSTDFADGIQGTLTEENEVYANNGSEGVHGRIQGSGTLLYNILNNKSTGNGTDGFRLDLFASTSLKADIAARGNEYTFSGRAGLRVTSDGQKYDLVNFVYERNLNDHNNFFGLELFNSSIFRKSISNNTITNNSGPGIQLDGNSEAHIDNNTISGNTTGILLNDASLAAINNNTITANSTGIAIAGTGTGIPLSANSLFNNSIIGVDLGNDGVTANDAGDADIGPNNLQNFPILTAASSSGGNTSIQGTLNSTPNTAFRIEFFSNTACSPSGFGEGQTFIGFDSLTTDANGQASFSVTLTGVTVAGGVSITSTATDINNNTSEFSKCLQAGGTLQQADLDISKTADKATYQPGDNISYTISLTNKGPDQATGIAVSDKLPAGLGFVSATPAQGSYDAATGLWTAGALNNGSVAKLTIVATAAQTGNITNTAAITAVDQPDPSAANNTSSITITVAQASNADLQLVKTADKASLNLGETVTYTLTLMNNGPSQATGITITDKLPAGLSFVSATPSQGSYDAATGLWTAGVLNNGSLAKLSIVATAAQAGNITNTATITTSDQPDPSAVNNTSSIAITVTQASSADLQLIKTVDKNSVNLGEIVSYTVTLMNNGPNTATGIAVTDKAPAGMQFGKVTASTGIYNITTGIWSIASLTNGSKAVLTISASATQSGAIVNNAAITASDQSDPNIANNMSSASVNVKQNLDVVRDIQSLINKVNALVVSGELTKAQGRRLTELLEIASALYGKGNTRAAISLLEAFSIQVNVLADIGQLSHKHAKELINDAQKIINEIQNGKSAHMDRVMINPESQQNENPWSIDQNAAKTITLGNYPNPFNGATVITIELIKGSHVDLSVFDNNGRFVTRLVNGVLPAGISRITWQPANLAAGIYTVQLKAGDTMKVHKMVYTK